MATGTGDNGQGSPEVQVRYPGRLETSGPKRGTEGKGSSLGVHVLYWRQGGRFRVHNRSHRLKYRQHERAEAPAVRRPE